MESRKTEYQVLARKYRPQTFKEVIGQDAIVITLKNAIRSQRLAHAYLFCGSRGTGKTTLARIFAKALNCANPSDELEPCGACSFCKEIASGHSLDVLEIDGASHRGIDDVRQINETVAYAAASGKYKVYIIDEVHMLTKEAFNALLKTLEEPPPKVKFFFCTTEPHKVLPTILSRCQRFNLSRIPTEKIISKLSAIAQDLGVTIEPEALRMVATRAEGGLRDAESILDQIIAFHEGTISVQVVGSILGIMPQDILFKLDQAGQEGNLATAFEVAHQIFTEGKDLIHFIETLIEHFRTILLMRLAGKGAAFLTLTEVERGLYDKSARIYTQEQCLNILEMLVEAQTQIRFAPSSRIALEAILLKILRTHQRLPIEFLVRRMTEIEQALGNVQQQPVGSMVATAPESPPEMPPPPEYAPQPQRPAPQPAPAQPQQQVQPLSAEERQAKMLKQNQTDTLLQFAAVEFEGKLQKLR